MTAEHCDSPFEVGDANAHRWLPVFLVDRDDATNLSADPAERRAARDLQLRGRSLFPDEVFERALYGWSSVRNQGFFHAVTF